jgi:hypothetical protein
MIGVIMSFLRKLIKNALPYYFVKKYQARSGGNPLAPGGYYSPIPSMREIKEYDFNGLLPEALPGIDLNANEQINLLDSFEPFYKELPFTDEKTEGLRFYYENGAYCYSDGIFLYCMIRHLKPQKLIEVGSGFSSSLILDTNERFMRKSIDCVFIDPHPAKLESLLKNDDKDNITIHKTRLQEIPIETFGRLNKNDILFNLPNVSKFNSDVNYIFHNILPMLAHGVYIHFHDIFYPFEYSRECLLEGIAWNEQYILRAFLEYNTDFKIVLFNTYLKNMHEAKIKNRFPLVYKDDGGSIWIKKI